MLMKQIIALLWVLLACVPAQAQLTQSAVDQNISQQITTNGTNAITGAILASTLDVMTTAIFQAQGVGGFILNGTQATGLFPIATSAAAVSWGSILPANSTTAGFSATTSNDGSATWDTQPLAAIHIIGPATATTRNFNVGLWVDTNGSNVNLGRGIIINNIGHSDSLYIKNSGTNSAGIALEMDDTSETAII